MDKKVQKSIHNAIKKRREAEKQKKIAEQGLLLIQYVQQGYKDGGEYTQHWKVKSL